MVSRVWPCKWEKTWVLIRDNDNVVPHTLSESLGHCCTREHETRATVPLLLRVRRVHEMMHCLATTQHLRLASAPDTNDVWLIQTPCVG